MDSPPHNTPPGHLSSPLEISRAVDAQRLELLLEATSDALWDFDLVTGTGWGSKQFHELFGYSQLLITTESALEIIHPDDRAGVISSFEKIIEKDSEHFSFEYRLRRADGSYARVTNKGRILYSPDGTPTRMAGAITDISEKTLSRKTADYLAQRFETIANVTNDALYDWDVKTDSIWYNDNFFFLLGFPRRPEVIPNDVWSDAVLMEDKGRISAAIEHAFQQHEDRWSCEYRIRRRDGAIAWISERATIVYGDDGDPVTMVGGMVDITARKTAEESLFHATERLNSIFQNAPIGIAVLTPDAHFLELNRAVQGMLGYTAEELTRLSFKDFTVPEDLEFELPLFAEVVAGHRDGYQFEKRCIRKNGSIFWARLVVSALKDARGDVALLIGMVEDIDKRKSAEQALEHSKDQFDRLMESGVVGIVHYDSSGRYFDANNAFLAITGYTAEEIRHRKMTFRDITPPEYKEQDARATEQYERGVTKPFEKEYIRKDGSRIPVIISLTKLNNDTGIAIVLDISERKRAQREVEKLARIIEFTEDAVISFGLDGAVQTWNAGAEHLYGFSASEAVNSPVYKVIPEDRLEEFRWSLDSVIEGAFLSHYESTRLSKSGERIPVSLTLSSIRDHDGQVVGLSEIARDLTAARNAELLRQKLVEAQKLEGLGRLAGGIAHDFNNLLMVITSYTEIIQYNFPIDDRLRGHTEQILKAANRAASLTQQLLAFSRKQVISPEVINLNSVLDEAAKMLKRFIGEHIEFSFLPGKDLGAVKTDPGQVVQMLMNLCVNARDAMPDGGRITVETANVEIDALYASTHPPITPGEYVMLSVKDTGKGMTEDVKAKAFEPFFTTKPLGKGTGLGLATVYGIVKQSNGHLWVESELGRGTCISIYLPRISGGVSAKLDSDSAAVQLGEETVLVVEDETALRESVCEFLMSCGYKVLTAENGEDALTLARKHPDPIHLLLTDVVMPKLSGKELGRRLVEERPDLLILYMSGFSDDTIVHHGVLEAGVALLQKPFTLGALARKIRGTLATKQN